MATNAGPSPRLTPEPQHIDWDQASVLVQLGLLARSGLPVAGAERTVASDAGFLRLGLHAVGAL